MCVNQKQTRVGRGRATRRSGSYGASSGRAESGTTTQAAEAAPAASAASQSRSADVGERLVDERLEALARLDGEAADGVRGVDGNASRCGDLLGEREQAVRAAHGQAVGEQRVDDVAIVAAVGARPACELAHERGAALAARALEAALPAQRRERRGRATGSARRAGSARSAARAPGRPARRGRRAPGSSPRRGRAAAATRSSPSARSSTRRTFVSSAVTWAPNAKHAIARAVYGPTPGSRSSSRDLAREPAELDDAPRGALEVERAAVVAEARPGAQDVGRGRGRERRGRRPALEPGS